jgi:replicative DNA helicase
MKTKPIKGWAPLIERRILTALDKVEARVCGASMPAPLPWPGLQLGLGGGLWPGLYVIGAVPGAGKTQLTVQIAVHAARKGVPVLFIQMDVPEDEMLIRLYSAIVGVHWSRVWLGDDRAGLTELQGAGKAPGLPIRLWLPEKPPTIAELEEAVCTFVDRHSTEMVNNPALVVVDYLQRLSGTGSDAKQRVSEAASVAGNIARNNNVAMVMISSVARVDYDSSRAKHDPSHFIGGAKESGDVEYAADAVIRMLVEGTRKDGTKKVTLAVAKNRHGLTGYYSLIFDGSSFKEPAPKRPLT